MDFTAGTLTQDRPVVYIPSRTFTLSFVGCAAIAPEGRLRKGAAFAVFRADAARGGTA